MVRNHYRDNQMTFAYVCQNEDTSLAAPISLDRFFAILMERCLYFVAFNIFQRSIESLIDHLKAAHFKHYSFNPLFNKMATLNSTDRRFIKGRVQKNVIFVLRVQILVYAESLERFSPFFSNSFCIVSPHWFNLFVFFFCMFIHFLWYILNRLVFDHQSFVGVIFQIYDLLSQRCVHWWNRWVDFHILIHFWFWLDQISEGSQSGRCLGFVNRATSIFIFELACYNLWLNSWVWCFCEGEFSCAIF